MFEAERSEWSCQVCKRSYKLRFWRIKPETAKQRRKRLQQEAALELSSLRSVEPSEASTEQMR